jgi:hypothetical protein
MAVRRQNMQDWTDITYMYWYVQVVGLKNGLNEQFRSVDLQLEIHLRNEVGKLASVSLRK